MNKKQKDFMKKEGWEFVKNGVAIDTDQFVDVEGECFVPSLEDLDYRKCSYWSYGELASDDEGWVLDMAGYDEEAKSSPSRISKCNSCNCMTYTKEGYIYICAKCGKDKRRKGG
jgi:hypothetical protein